MTATEYETPTGSFVARVEVSTWALRDLARVFNFIAETDPRPALAQLSSVRSAFEVLADHPLLGQ